MAEDKLLLSVVSCVYREDALKGYLVTTAYASDTKYVKVDEVSRLARFNFANVTYSKITGAFNGVGRPLVEYPRIDENYNLMTPDALTLLSKIVDRETGEAVGITCMNGKGRELHITFDRLLTYLNSYGTTNFQPVILDGGRIDVVCSNQVDLPVAYLKRSQGHSLAYRSGNGEERPVYIAPELPTDLPVVGEYNLNSVAGDADNKTTQHKMMQAGYALKKLSPYYSVIYSGIDKKLTPGLGTFGVTENLMIYDHKFTASLLDSELLFVLLHEISHICMQHSIRKGNRNHELWNIATDLYINSILMEDFGLEIGVEKTFDVVNSKGDPDKVRLKTPQHGVYLESIGEVLDLSKDTPESIYARLVKENPIADVLDISKPSQGANKGKTLTREELQKIVDETLENSVKRIQAGIDNMRKGAENAMETALDKELAKQAKEEIDKGLDKMQDALDRIKDAINKENLNDLEQAVQDLKDAIKETQEACEKMQEAQGKNQDGNQQENSQQGAGQQGDGQQDGGQSDMQGGQDGGQQGDGQQGDGQQGSGSGQSGMSQIGDGCDLARQSANNLQDIVDLLTGRASSSTFGQGTPTSIQTGQSDGQAGDGQEGDGQEGSGQSSNLANGKGYNSARVDGDANGEKPQFKEVKVKYNGKVLTGTVMMDVMTNENAKSDDERDKRISESKTALQRVKTQKKMFEEKNGVVLDKTLKGASLLQRYIEFGLSSGIDWRVLMRNLCVDKPKKMYTLAMPNQDYMNQGITLAERHKIGKPTRAAKFVVALDISGSVSEDMLMWYLSEVNNLTKKYDVEAELVYWSTEVGDAGMFSDLKDMLKIQPNTTGGTNVLCLFEYLNGEITTQTGKKEPLKLRDIKGVFIITDGCFSNNYGHYAEKFSNKVVWLIDGNPVTFDAAFGRVIGLKREDEK